MTPNHDMDENRTVKLHVTVKNNYSTVYSPESNPEKAIQTARKGPFRQDYFPGMTIESIGDGNIVIAFGNDTPKVLVPGETVMFSYGKTVETYDGCTFGNHYSCQIEWPL